MKVAIASRASEAAEVIRQLLSPWSIMFTDSDEADVLMVYGKKPTENVETIVIPSDSIDFTQWLKDEGLSVVREPGRQTLIAATPRTVLSIVPETQYRCDRATGTIASATQAPLVRLNDDTLVLTLDIVEEYNKIMSETLKPKFSNLYRLVTRLPIPYKMAPERLRNLLMRSRMQEMTLNLYDKLPMDAMRFLLARSLEEIGGEKLTKKTWNGKNYALAVTHDVESRLGLERAKTVKKLEEKYNLPSAWYIPSKHYRLDRETVRTLENYGEVGAHDTKHDGKLGSLPRHETLKRLREAKQALEQIVHHQVEGFRSPLLEHNSGILCGLKKAGYSYDTSIPSWEPRHPRTMHPHGVGTTYPMFLDGLTEIPISAVQDHQLLYVLGLEPKEAIASWISMMAVIKGIGGCCVLLSHPEYRLLDRSNLAVYEELLNVLGSDEQAWFTTPKHLADEARK